MHKVPLPLLFLEQTYGVKSVDECPKGDQGVYHYATSIQSGNEFIGLWRKWQTTSDKTNTRWHFENASAPGIHGGSRLESTVGGKSIQKLNLLPNIV